ncbi:MAG: type II secretion system F family protein [Deltaproteobacteria bacterium]|nr:type II secretion system F family protein [Deltaproteobacteria bacterium]RLB95412.1 MAG: type II secretion system F family protein [Deltaproteobacteria bacterium]
MPVFIWEGKNRKNETIKGELEAPGEEAVRAHLARMKLVPVKIKKKPKDLLENVSWAQPRVTEADVILFCRQFSTMLDAGLPIIQCLDILQQQQENKRFKKILKDVKESVEGGQTFAEALKKYPQQFDDLFVNMVAAGEASGVLDTILKRLSNYLEKAAKLKKRIKGAMVYPAITLLVAVIVVGIIMVFVIPVFEQMFADFGGQLPAPTQFVVSLSRMIRANILYLLGAVVIAVFALRQVRKTEKGRAAIDRYLLTVPLFGPLLRKVAVAKFSRTLGTMLASGVSILDALDIVAKTSGNRTVETAIYRVRQGIAEGRTMSEPLAESGVFPAMVCQMIAVGESTGALDAMLAKIADFYDEEVDQAVENLTAAIEPVMMVFMGVVIGGLVVSMYLPIFKMAGAITG